MAWECDGVLCVCFFNDTATTEIYTLSLHDALPIYMKRVGGRGGGGNFAAGVSWPYRRPRLLENIIKLYIREPFLRAKQSEELGF